jgi:hypothetical protein
MEPIQCKGPFAKNTCLLHYFGEIFPNFKVKNMTSTYTQVFSWKKWPKHAKSQRKKFQIARFLS